MTKPIDMDQLMELVEALQFVDDPRVQGRVKHLLGDVLVISICAILCGAEGIYEIELFGKSKETWLRKFLELPAGVPSHDTIARVLTLVNPHELEQIFREWVQDVIGDNAKPKSISIDGKCSNGTERGFNKSSRPLHMVSAYAHESGLCLGQSQAKSSGLAESNAAIDCLKSLDLKGTTINADAGLATRKVIEQIFAQGGNYVVPVKSNQRHSYEELVEVFENSNDCDEVSQKEKAHGRQEERSCRSLSARDLSAEFKGKWPGIKTIFCICRTRTEKDKRFFLQKTGPDGKQHYEKNTGSLKSSEETTYYVSSLNLTPAQALTEVRRHWQIENNLHWILDVAFREDDWTVKAKRLARNLSLIRKIALNLIRTSNTKGSVRSRIKKAGWETDFMEQILFGRQF